MNKLLFCILFVAAIARGDEQRTDRVIENPVSDGDIYIRVNDGGVKTNVIQIDGATSTLNVLTSIGSATTVSGKVTSTGFESAIQSVSMPSSASQTVDFTNSAVQISGNSVYLASLFLPENSTNYAMRSFYVLQGGDATVAPIITSIANADVGTTSIGAPTSVACSSFRCIRVTVDPTFTDDTIKLTLTRLGSF